MPQLGEAPTTDAEYVAAVKDLASEITTLAESLEEYQAALIEQVGFDQSALKSYDMCAESLRNAAEAAGRIVSDFMSTYQGVIETAQAGVKIPGDGGKFWTGDVG